MAESILSVCWKEHTSVLATAYKSLLESNFLVDCTISAEGQNLKAHRLVLSASSPYFQELFSEETGKHPFVILLDASFETLKAVIDFVYRGEVQISKGNLKPFLTLAQSLQIKGLNSFTQDYEIENRSGNTIENVSEKNQVTCEIQGAANLPPATQQRSGPQGSKTPLPEVEGEEPVPSATDREALTSSSSALAGRSGTNDRPFVCDVCGASFTMRCSLLIHNRSHKRDRPLACDVCGVSFIERSNLVAHKRTHTEGRPFSCGRCAASFTKRSQLVSHSRSHTGERPFSCGFCGASFTLRHHLVSHRRTHAGERPYPCDVCGKAFVLAHHLARHKRLHTGDRPHRCEFCEKTFVEKHDLRLHRCIHTGERPHLCQFCGKGFIQKHELNSHLRTHTGE